MQESPGPDRGPPSGGLPLAICQTPRRTWWWLTGGCHDQRVNTVSDIPVVVVVVSNNRQWSCLTFSLELPGATLGLEECCARSDCCTDLSLTESLVGTPVPHHLTVLYTHVQSSLYTIHHHHIHIPQVRKNHTNWSPYFPIP